MILTVKLPTVEFQHEVQGANNAFDLAAAIHEVFGEPCGVCGSSEVKPVSWKKEGRTNRKLVCKCGAEVFVNAPRDGGRIFIGRKDRDGNPMPNRGWSVYDATRGQSTTTAPTSAPTTGDANEEVPFKFVGRQAVLQMLGDEAEVGVLSPPADGRWASRQVQSLHQRRR